MHQEHNIPWKTLASNFQFIRDNPRYTPRINAGIFIRNLPHQTSQFQHFVRAFSNTVDTFAQTERAKYPISFPTPTSDQVFTDGLRHKYPDFLNERNQRIEFWISSGKLYGYNTSHGSLADVVKILIHENQLSTLLMLAQHLDIPLHQLCHLSWGHHFGFSRGLDSSLRAYIFFNVAAAMGILGDGRYREMDYYPELVRYLNNAGDYPGQQVLHRQFFEEYRVPPSGEGGQSPAVHQDLSRLRQYMKDLFATMYRYDIVMKECGRDPEWDYEITGAFRWLVLGPDWHCLVQK